MTTETFELLSEDGRAIPEPGRDIGKMKPARKKEFLAALETPPSEGGYLQVKQSLTGSRRVLKDEAIKLGISPGNYEGFCCLGVGTNEMAKKGLLTWDTINVCKTPDEGANVDSADDWGGQYYHGLSLKEWRAEQKKAGRVVVKMGDDGYRSYEATYEDSGFPGHVMLKYWGLTPAACSYLAAEMNDDNFTFKDIAQAVRAYL